MAAHILLLDDDRLVRESLELELGDAGYRVTAVAGFDEALAAAGQACFDLILSDVRLPKRDGLEAVEALRALQPMARVVMMTGYASPDAPVRAVKLRVDDYLLKPFTTEALLASLETALARYREGAQDSPERFRDNLLRALEHARQSEDGHRLVRQALRCAHALGFSVARTRRLALAAWLHELGPLAFAPLQEEATFVHYQEERWDGSGPRGLRGEQIPLESRILAACRQLPGSDPRLLEILAGEAPPPALPAAGQPGRLERLLELAEKARSAGNLTLAQQAYREALDEPGEPELHLQARDRWAHLLRAQGERERAEEQARLGLAEARGHRLDLWAARFVLQIPASRADLEQARQTFAVWEAGYERALCDLFLAAQGDAEHYARFLEQEVSARELLPQHRDPLVRALTLALRSGWQPEGTRAFLERAQEQAAALLEEWLAQADAPLRFRALEMASSLSHRDVRALLGRWQGGLLPEAAGETAPTLQVQFLGGFRVTAGGRALEEEDWPSRKVRSLFGYLASRRGRVVKEQTLIDLFWEQGGEKALHSLHNAVSDVRKVLGRLLGPGPAKLSVRKKREGYVFGQELACWVDLEEFEERAARGLALAQQGLVSEALVQMQGAERLYTGPLDEGLAQEWEAELLLGVRGRLLEILAWMGRYFFGRGKWDASAEYWHKILLHDNCHEEAYLGLMLCHHQSDRSSEAIRLYHQGVQTLKKELNLGPPPRLAETYLRMVGGQPVDLNL